jgi:periplasmic copper chaperone A
MRRTLQFLGCVAATTLAVGLFASQASAHVTISTLGTVQAGGFAKLAISVPNERPDAGTVKLSIRMPKDQAIPFVSVQPKPGWEVVTTTRHLAAPVSDEGETISDVVDTVTWTATGDTQIAPGQFDQFWISLGPIPDVSELSFPAIQTYSSGEEVAWVEPMGANGEPEHPAPIVAVLSSAAAATVGNDNDSNGLAVVALIVGGVGVALGAAGLFYARRARTQRDVEEQTAASREPVSVG